jgi:hypothetical protein
LLLVVVRWTLSICLLVAAAVAAVQIRFVLAVAEVLRN